VAPLGMGRRGRTAPGNTIQRVTLDESVKNEKGYWRNDYMEDRAVGEVKMTKKGHQLTY